jgi:hypothetical protein
MKIQKIFLLITIYFYMLTTISACKFDSKKESNTDSKTTDVSTSKNSGTKPLVTNQNIEDTTNSDKNNLNSIKDINEVFKDALDRVRIMAEKKSGIEKCGIFIDNSKIEVQENFYGGYVDCKTAITIIFNPQKARQGHKLQMIAKILASDHQWKIGSSSQVEGTTKGLSILIDNEIGKQAEKELESDFSTQITVGTASSEGDNISEKERAQQRAVAIRQFITSNYGTRPKYLLNLGKFQDNKCNKKYFHNTISTRYQRPVIIMSIIRESNSPEPDKIEIEKIVKKNLDSLGYGLSYKCYADFDLVLF